MTMQPRGDLFPGPEDWQLAPEGAAIYPAERTAVIADVHLGYEWARAAGGDLLPAHSLGETLARLEGLLRRAPLERLIVAGDLVEAFGPCPRTDGDLRRLRSWLVERHVDLVALRGDHDRRFAWPETIEVGGWTIAHGSRPITADRWIHGHVHPALRTEGRSWPCFLIGPRRIVVPAFSANAAGLDVGTATLPPQLPRDALRCVAVAGEEWLDFGPLNALRAALWGG